MWSAYASQVQVFLVSDVFVHEPRRVSKIGQCTFQSLPGEYADLASMHRVMQEARRNTTAYGVWRITPLAYFVLILSGDGAK